MTDSTATSPHMLYSPLHTVHLAAGASFTDFAGWQMPVRYGSELAEHHAVRTSAGIFDLSHMAEISVTGAGAGAALDVALAGLISAVTVGQAKYSLLLAPDGGIIDDLVVYRTGEADFLIVANAANRAVVVQELGVRAAGHDCVVTDRSDETALIAVQGPRAREIIMSTEGIVVDDLTDLKYYRLRPGRFGGESLLIARTGYTGEDGFELYVDATLATDLWAALVFAGTDAGLVPAGLASRDTLRLEAGMPLYGHELSRGILPVQAGLGRVPNLGKEFVGSAAIEAGPAVDAPVLVGLRLEGRRAGRADYPVLNAGPAAVAVGSITSGALSPTLGYPIAMAYIEPALSSTGTRVAVDIRGSIVAASVVEFPFYKRSKDAQKSN